MRTRTRYEIVSEVFCPSFHEAAELVGRKWTGAILRAMLHDVSHFNEIKNAIPSLSPRMLSERLKELEAAGIVRREVIPTMPVRTEYHLTEKGRQLGPVLDAIEEWARVWIPPVAVC